MGRIVALGEIMARFSPPGYQRLGQAMPGALDVLFAGAEASVAMSIAQLGGQSTFVTALPRHELADACVASLRSVGVDTRHILRVDAGRLGLYFLEAGVNQRPSKVIYDRADSAVAITPPQAYPWEAILGDASWLVLSGITPAISASGAALTQRAIDEAGKRGVRVLYDLNYRGKLWRWDPSRDPRTLAIATIRDSLPGIDLLVAGADEIEELLGEPPAESTVQPPQRFASAAQRLVQRYPRMSLVASTRRLSHSASCHEVGGMLWEADAALLHTAPDPASAASQLYRIEQIVDRIGTGDAFTAALLFGLTNDRWNEPRQALQLAAAAFCLAHSVLGDFNCTSLPEVEALLAGDTSGRVQR